MISAILAGIYFKYYITENILTSTMQKQAQELAEGYVYSVWNRYYPVIGFIADQPAQTEKSYTQFLAFEEESKGFFTSRQMVKAVIHLNNKVIFSSNDQVLTPKTGFMKSWFGSNHIEENLQTTFKTLQPTSLMTQATITYNLRVWYSVHFGYYFYASRGDILVCEIFGELMDRKKIAETTLKRIEPGSEPLLNETPPTLVLCPPRQKYESRLPYTIGSDPRRLRLVRWSDGSDSRIVGYVGE